MLAELPGFGERITYQAGLSEPAEGWAGPTGFIHEIVRDALGDTLPAHEAYFAGPPAMAKAMQLMLRGAGVPWDQIHFDEFF